MRYCFPRSFPVSSCFSLFPKSTCSRADPRLECYREIERSKAYWEARGGITQKDLDEAQEKGQARAMIYNNRLYVKWYGGWNQGTRTKATLASISEFQIFPFHGRGSEKLILVSIFSSFFPFCQTKLSRSRTNLYPILNLFYKREIMGK